MDDARPVDGEAFFHGRAMAAECEREGAGTRRMLERIPWERALWQPHPKSWPLGSLAVHLAHLWGWPASIVRTRSLDLASPEAAAMVPGRPASTADLLAALDRNIAASCAALREAGPGALGETWILRHGERVLLTMPRAEVIRTMGFNHAIHHRGQLALYLRLLDIPVPGMYGSSADEA